MTIKVKVVESEDDFEFQEEINKFLESELSANGYNLIDIKYQHTALQDSAGHTIHGYSAVIIYKI